MDFARLAEFLRLLRLAQGHGLRESGLHRTLGNGMSDRQGRDGGVGFQWQVRMFGRPFCYIVSEMMMKTMNGIEAAIEVLCVLPFCKVHFISCNTADDYALLEDARAKGFKFDTLEKHQCPRLNCWRDYLRFFHAPLTRTDVAA